MAQIAIPGPTDACADFITRLSAFAQGDPTAGVPSAVDRGGRGALPIAAEPHPASGDGD